VTVEKVDATHYMAEEIPDIISQKIIDFCTDKAMEASRGENFIRQTTR
jgi:hypothetical protein